MKYNKYLSIKHDYLSNNCITLIAKIYKQELNSDIFNIVWNEINMPEGKPKNGRWWMKNYSLEHLEKSASLIAYKIDITQLKEFDFIIFRSGRLIATHFGMYISSNKFIHLEEGKYTKIDILNEVWRERIVSIWRANGINT